MSGPVRRGLEGPLEACGKLLDRRIQPGLDRSRPLGHFSVNGGLLGRLPVYALFQTPELRESKEDPLSPEPFDQSPSQSLSSTRLAWSQEKTRSCSLISAGIPNLGRQPKFPAAPAWHRAFWGMYAGWVTLNVLEHLELPGVTKGWSLVPKVSGYWAPLTSIKHPFVTAGMSMHFLK